MQSIASCTVFHSSDLSCRIDRCNFDVLKDGRLRPIKILASHADTVTVDVMASRNDHTVLGSTLPISSGIKSTVNRDAVYHFKAFAVGSVGDINLVDFRRHIVENS